MKGGKFKPRRTAQRRYTKGGPSLRSAIQGVSDAALPKVGRNNPCPCGSNKKFKRCQGAPPPTQPVCSAEGCDEEVKFFLSPSMNGMRSEERYWVACAGHVEAISANAAQHGLNVDVIPFDSISGRVISSAGLDVVKEPILGVQDEGDAPSSEGGE